MTKSKLYQIWKLTLITVICLLFLYTVHVDQLRARTPFLESVQGKTRQSNASFPVQLSAAYAEGGANGRVTQLHVTYAVNKDARCAEV